MSNVIAMPDRESPRGRVAAEVRAEMARARLSGNRLGKLTGKSQAYWWRRLSGDVALDVDDLATIAGLLGVPITRFFAEAAGTPGPTGPGGGGEWAPWGSNPQPTDETSPQVSDVEDNVVFGPWSRPVEIEPTESVLA